MFSAIAGRYDLLNRLLSAGIDLSWRRRTVETCARDAAGDAPPRRVLDVCAGTGDLVLAWRRALPGARVVGADFSAPMVRIAHRKAREEGGPPRPPLLLAVADTLRLPFKGGAFDLVSIAFGLRNLVDLDGGLREMARVTRPGGRVVVLEFTQPPGRVFRALYYCYLNVVLPAVGRLMAHGRTRAYRYLAQTVRAFPGPERLAEIMRLECGGEVSYTLMTGGVVAAHVARVGSTGRGTRGLPIPDPR
ncbi:MAG: ubiquinone/menaquinone biosynthesis methyltransferase, partial [Planctomycetes bacterium]|nr:ubiquinone/menaquinone biosynthesis methyltransferase [Planctomycetota bacterium]